MKKKFRKTAIIFTSLVLILAMTVVSFGAEEDYIGDEELLENILLPDETGENEYPLTRVADVQYLVSFAKSSTGRATAKVDYSCFEKVDTITSTITLQVYSSGKYVNTSAASAVQSAHNTRSIGHTAVFKISEGKKYRIKMSCKVTVGQVTKTHTFYESLK